jgi:glycosidase
MRSATRIPPVQHAMTDRAVSGPASGPLRCLPSHPALYEVDTRSWMTELARALGRPATLEDVPDAQLDAIAELGFDWVWLLSVWETGPAGREVSRTRPDLRREYEASLPDLREDDIGGSGFAVVGYTVSTALGGDDGLASLRQRLRSRGIRLMLDFVPNHTALDHPWVEDHPERYVRGSDLDLMRAPSDWTWVRRSGGDLLLAHGRDPFFPGWPDTLQLDYSIEDTVEAMTGELLRISDRCDGVRCDMAMLLLPDVFERTWGRRALPFWADAMARVRARHPGFWFLAEVYWDLEWTMMGLGFDYAYDKRLYDRLRAGAARPVREHLGADPGYQHKLARFLENHDEPRAAAAFAPAAHEAAAVVTYLIPGLRFFQQGQLEGRRVRIPTHLVRRPHEPVDDDLRAFYGKLLDVVGAATVRDGAWQLLAPMPAWDGNRGWDDFVAWSWRGDDGKTLVAVVNLGAGQAQCYVRLPFTELRGRALRLVDLLHPIAYDRGGDDLVTRGLYLDLAGHGYHVFALETGEP